MLPKRLPIIHRSIVITLTVVYALAATACTVYKSSSPSETSNLRRVTDEAGRSLNVPAKIDRVVSLAPNLTEIIYAVGAGEQLVGNTTFCDYPEAARTVPKVGDTLQPSIERILSLKPQVVLVSTASQLEAFTRKLAEHGIVVYVTDPRDLEGVFRSLEHLGQLLNREEQSQQVVNQMRERATSITEMVKLTTPVRVFYQLSAEPLYTAGRDAFVTDLIRRAGGISVTAEIPEAWPTFSQESAVASRPEAIVLPTGGSMGSANSDVAAGLKNSPAVLNGKVYRINGDFLSRPGPRAVDGLAELARALHPEVFGK
ncbi:MAG TPA: cobalamin-binding protein [Pyrinomonadaceae bacterium]|nr:cobalamin-binding protein [Pyrinomonadaceae bacterium]